MRISILLQREPFGTIIEKTLSSFLQSRDGQSYEVQWQQGRSRLSTIRSTDRQLWLCNIYLNAIFLSDAPAIVFDPVKKEFARSTVWWRRPAQMAYAIMATSNLGAPWLAQAQLLISPGLPDGLHLLIVPGNNKIRLLDYRQMVAYGILKSGFPPGFFQREIQSRRSVTQLGLPVPQLKSVAEDKSWFIEDYISGTPVNRVGDVVQARQAIAQAFHVIKLLQQNTITQESLCEYADRLAEQAQNLIDANLLLSETQKRSSFKAVNALLTQIKFWQSSANGPFFTTFTHGDFQSANILADQNRIWLIDWEYAGRRQRAYDALTFLLASRFPKGLASRLWKFVLQGSTLFKMDDIPWPGIKWHQKNIRQFHCSLFLLEEMLLRLEQNDNILFKSLDQGFEIFLKEVSFWMRAVGEADG